MAEIQKEAKKLVVSDKCIGCGACVAIAGEVFEFNDEGRSVIKADADFGSASIQDAIDTCPIQAISYK